MDNEELRSMPTVTVEQVVRFRAESLARIATLEAELKGREWISVEDRLPEDGFYLIYASSYNYQVTATANLLTGGWIVDPNINVTHWQPLPSPPQEQS